MHPWNKTKAERVSKLVQNAITALAEYNEENDRLKHDFSCGPDLQHHADAKAAERALWGIKGTFDRLATVACRRKPQR